MSNKKTMDPLINTLVGIDNVATRELEDPSGSEPTAELTIIMMLRGGSPHASIVPNPVLGSVGA